MRWVAFQSQEVVSEKLEQSFLILQEKDDSIVGYRYSGRPIMGAGSIVN
jgi:hypothetical protein